MQLEKRCDAPDTLNVAAAEWKVAECADMCRAHFIIGDWWRRQRGSRCAGRHQQQVYWAMGQKQKAHLEFKSLLGCFDNWVQLHWARIMTGLIRKSCVWVASSMSWTAVNFGAKILTETWSPSLQKIAQVIKIMEQESTYFNQLKWTDQTAGLI